MSNGQPAVIVSPWVEPGSVYNEEDNTAPPPYLHDDEPPLICDPSTRGPACDALTLRLDGTAAATTIHRKRSVFYAVSLWLNGGVAATDVANRAGHSVEVLLRVYAKCIDGGEEAANRRIDEALAV